MINSSSSSSDRSWSSSFCTRTREPVRPPPERSVSRNRKNSVFCAFPWVREGERPGMAETTKYLLRIRRIPPPRNTPYSPKYRFCYYVLPRVGHPPPFFLFFFFFEFLTQQIASFFRPKNWGIEIFEIFLPIANSTFFLFFFFECPIMLNLTILGP